MKKFAVLCILVVLLFGFVQDVSAYSFPEAPKPYCPGYDCTKAHLEISQEPEIKCPGYDCTGPVRTEPDITPGGCFWSAGWRCWGNP